MTVRIDNNAAMDFQEIIKALPALERGEVERVRAACTAILHLTPDAGDVTEKDKVVQVQGDDELWVIHGIRSVLQSLGVEYPGMGLLQRAPEYSSFKEKIPGLMEYLRKAHPQRRCQFIILRLGIKLLLDNLRQLGLAISARALLRHIHRLPSVLNAAFPGYAEAGMLGMLIKQKDRAYARHKPRDQSARSDTQGRERPPGQ